MDALYGQGSVIEGLWHSPGMTIVFESCADQRLTSEKGSS